MALEHVDSNTNHHLMPILDGKIGPDCTSSKEPPDMAILSRVSEILPISSEVDVEWVHSKAYQPPLVPAVHSVSSGKL